MEKIPVTVIIPVRNEANNLPKCLEKLQLFSEVIVVDSGSEDDTPFVVKQHGAILVDFKWNGQFPKKRNWTLINYPIGNEWVLFLDADEFLTESFINKLQEILPKTDCNGFWLTYENHFMGKKLRFGDRMRKLALFRKDYGRYERIDDFHWTNLDMEVHEHPIVSGKIGSINEKITHRDYRGLEHYIAKHNSYSTWEAQRFVNLDTIKKKNLNKRQKIKYNLIQLGILPYVYFFVSYILKGGIFDGIIGLRFAILKAQYFYHVQLKIKELYSKPRLN